MLWEDHFYWFRLWIVLRSLFVCWTRFLSMSQAEARWKFLRVRVNSKLILIWEKCFYVSPREMEMPNLATFATDGRLSKLLSFWFFSDDLFTWCRSWLNCYLSDVWKTAINLLLQEGCQRYLNLRLVINLGNL